MASHGDTSILQLLIRLVADRSGATAITMALAFPVLLLSSFGAVDLTSVISGRTALQNAADAAAVQGASQLTFDQSDATNQRTIQFANGQIASLTGWTASVSAKSDPSAGSMTVTVDGTFNSAVTGIVMAGGWHVHLTSTAVANAKRPLCVLGTYANQHDVIHVQDQSSILSSGCMIQSDSDIHLDNSASIVAGDVRAVTSANGSISPAPVTDAPPVADPFSTMNINVPTVCDDSDKLQYSTGTQSLNPGVHCGTTTLSGDAILMLNPGEHYFIKGNFHLTGNAQMVGSDVALIFKAHYDLKFDQNAMMSLEGRHSGPYAGFVLVTARDYQGSFEISTARARKLFGTLYLPSTTLAVQGDNNAVADESPWTVIVAQKIQVTGSAKLVVNANYSASTVPVPSGVGAGIARLTQ